MADTMTEERLTGDAAPGVAGRSSMWSRPIFRIARFDVYDVVTTALIAALVIVALCTFKDYAISNDEEVQHRYGELIIAYYTSGFADQRLFSFQNLSLIHI